MTLVHIEIISLDRVRKNKGYTGDDAAKGECCVCVSVPQGSEPFVEMIAYSESQLSGPHAVNTAMI